MFEMPRSLEPGQAVQHCLGEHLSVGEGARHRSAAPVSFVLRDDGTLHRLRLCPGAVDPLVDKGHVLALPREISGPGSAVRDADLVHAPVVRVVNEKAVEQGWLCGIEARLVARRAAHSSQERSRDRRPSPAAIAAFNPEAGSCRRELPEDLDSVPARRTNALNDFVVSQELARALRAPMALSQIGNARTPAMPAGCTRNLQRGGCPDVRSDDPDATAAGTSYLLSDHIPRRRFPSVTASLAPRSPGRVKQVVGEWTPAVAAVVTPDPDGVTTSLIAPCHDDSALELVSNTGDELCVCQFAGHLCVLMWMTNPSMSGELRQMSLMGQRVRGEGQ